jgi:hypothetical protein
MPSQSTLPSAAPRNALQSDENWVFKAVGIFLLASLMLATAGYQYLQHSKKQEQSREERQRYKDYLQSSQPSLAPQEPKPVQTEEQPQPPAATTAESTAQRLLKHPAVTLGPGFDAPGVQQTGVTIIDAMDHAQGNAH